MAQYNSVRRASARRNASSSKKTKRLYISTLRLILLYLSQNVSIPIQGYESIFTNITNTDTDICYIGICLGINIILYLYHMSLNSDTNMGVKNCTDKNSCMMAYCHYRYQYLYGISVSGICIDKCICIGSPLIS